MEYQDLRITVYVANLKKRTDRLTHIQEQFVGKPEFDVNYVEAIAHEIGPMGLWLTLNKCVRDAKEKGEDVIVFCEDDHEFTANYTKDFLFRHIVMAYQLGADLLIGGSAGGFSAALPVSNHLMWVNKYWSNQFLIIYDNFFDPILEFKDFDPKKKVDNTLAELALNKFVLFPYISKQRIFGYSDVTAHNNEFPEGLGLRFEQAEKHMESLLTIFKLYHPDTLD